MDSNDAAALLDAHPEAIGVHDHPAGPVLVLGPTPGGEVQRALDIAMLETGIAVVDEGMVFRDTLAAYRETMAVPEPARATPARVHKPLRLRVCLSYDGPPWLSLLTQCAWLRGGIIGERVVHQPTS
jgi:hypothetical protein